MSKVCSYCLCVDGHMGPCPHQEIERLNVENIELRAQLADQHKVWVNLKVTELQGKLEELFVKNERLRAENARIRAALEKAPHDPMCGTRFVWDKPRCNCWKQAALAGEEKV